MRALFVYPEPLHPDGVQPRARFVVRGPQAGGARDAPGQPEREAAAGAERGRDRRPRSRVEARPHRFLVPDDAVPGGARPGAPPARARGSRGLRAAAARRGRHPPDDGARGGDAATGCGITSAWGSARTPSSRLVARYERGEPADDVPNFLSWRGGRRPADETSEPAAADAWVRNPVGEFPSLVELPEPDYELFDTGRITEQKHGWFGLLTSPGVSLPMHVLPESQGGRPLQEGPLPQHREDRLLPLPALGPHGRRDPRRARALPADRDVHPGRRPVHDEPRARDRVLRRLRGGRDRRAVRGQQPRQAPRPARGPCVVDGRVQDPQARHRVGFAARAHQGAQAAHDAARHPRDRRVGRGIRPAHLGVPHGRPSDRDPRGALGDRRHAGANADRPLPHLVLLSLPGDRGVRPGDRARPFLARRRRRGFGLHRWQRARLRARGEPVHRQARQAHAVVREQPPRPVPRRSGS